MPPPVAGRHFVGRVDRVRTGLSAPRTQPVNPARVCSPTATLRRGPWYPLPFLRSQPPLQRNHKLLCLYTQYAPDDDADDNALDVQTRTGRVRIRPRGGSARVNTATAAAAVAAAANADPALGARRSRPHTRTRLGGDRPPAVMSPSSSSSHHHRRHDRHDSRRDDDRSPRHCSRPRSLIGDRPPVLRNSSPVPVAFDDTIAITIIMTAAASI
ncbi:Hypothetical protein CINCED_3A006954 [Cinara cedri]|uniref:Uncharacterized protein n=1 Tax=Cinara cedri TaxID=506608 RepID=A0A5E4MA61_9HEMI|nr:Hypothetical protein CINCED_3A006954 [Cinara cedri]